MIFEGFNIFGKEIQFTDEHEEIMNTSVSGGITHKKVYIYDLKTKIDVYSIFKRIQIDDYYRPYYGSYDNKNNDGNPVLYALKYENNWKFCNLKNFNKFWYRFEQILYNFLNDHNNNFDTVLCIPSSNNLNTNILNSIEKIANKVGINHIIKGGIKTMQANVVLDAIKQPDSHFRKLYKNEKDYQDALIIINAFINKMNNENNGIFKYHTITDTKLRKQIINTLYIDPVYDYEYRTHINDKNVLIIDDSITLGQSIKNCIHALTTSYNPKTLSVLTMFSELHDKYGNETRNWEDTIYKRI